MFQDRHRILHCSFGRPSGWSESAFREHHRAFRGRRGQTADYDPLLVRIGIGNDYVGVIEAAVTYGLGLAFGAIS